VNSERLVNRNNIVFDIDGVLIDCSERLRKCEEESNGDRKAFWSCFLSPKYMHLDKPIEFGFEILKDRIAIAKGFNVVIITGRTDNMASETLEQLRAQGIEGMPIVFRKTGNLAKDYIYKLSAAKRLGLDVKEVHDDSAEVLKSFGEAYPNAKLYLYILQ
jgi:3-deoxy-D-manno-octulosonate 8-phosphate phosphatase KdsC-like HAD superfamily phosphatase